MKKSFRIISIMVAVIMVVSSVFTSMFYVSGDSEKNYGKTIYDFEDGKDYLDYAIPNNSYNKDSDGDGVIDGAKVEIITENEGTENENSYLRLQGICSNTTGVIVNFPYELENGATYTLSYKIKDDGLSYIAQNAKAAGIYVGKATGKSELSTYAQMDTKQYGHNHADRLACIYEEWNGNTSVQYVSISSENFVEVSQRFTVPDNAVNNDFKYLQFYYYPKAISPSTDKWEYIDIDDISIEVAPFEVSVVTNEKDVVVDSVYGYEGETVYFPETDKEGYTFLGWYKDAEFTVPYEESKITMPKGNVTIYAKYKNNSILYLDFEDNNNFLDFGIPENSSSAGANIEVVTENDGSEKNKFLRLTASVKSKSGVVVNLPFELEKGVSYGISYKIRDDGQSFLLQSEIDGAGIYVGKSTGINDISYAQMDTKDFRGSKLLSIHTDYRKTNVYYGINSEKFITVNKVFTVGENIDINDEFKYLQFYYYPKTKSGSTDDLEYIDIDDIHIQKLSESLYDFEDGTDYLDFAIPNNSYDKDSDSDGVIDGAKVEIITENEGTENENSYLRLQGLCASTTGVIVNFPYELENGATYTISYKIKDDGLSYIAQNAKASGIYVGKATGKSELSTYAQMDTKQYGHNHADRLACMYDDWNGNTSVQYVNISTESFVEVTKTFTVPENAVDDNFKYLQFYYYPKTAASSTEKWEYIDIDDIYIIKSPNVNRSTVSFVTNVSDISFEKITDVVGSTRSFDYISVYGYRVEGVYTDKQFSSLYTKDRITFGLEDITLYVKLEETNNNILRFENDSDVVKFAGDFSFSYEPKDDGSYNRALAMSKNDSYAVLPYTLEPNKEYVVNFKYKASSTAISPRLYILAGNAGEGSIVGGGGFTSTRQHSVFGSTDLTATEYVTVTDFDWQWREVTFKFKTNDNVTEIYDHLVLAGRVPFNINSTQVGYLYIDDFQLKEYVGEINFDVSYEGQNIDINPIYAEIGESIQLPQTVIEPFELEGWYSDSEFTQKISENEYTVTADHTTLYGKVSYKSTAHIDFEDSSQLLFSGAGWTAVMSELKTDDSDIDNHLLKMEIKRLNSSAVRLNYQFRPNRIYEISVKYRAISDTNNATLGLYALGTDNLTNGYGSLYHNPDNRPFSAVAPLVTSSVISKEWTEVTATISTDQPLIDSVYKYLCIYLSSSSSVLDAVIEIDDIIITDKGSFDPTKLDVLDSNSWTIKEEDMSIWKDSESWITGLYEQDIIEEDTYFVNEELEEDSYFENEELEEDSYFEEDDESEEEIQQTTVKKRRKKKVVTVVKKGNWLPLIIGISVAVAVAATSVVFLIVKRKRKKTA